MKSALTLSIVIPVYNEERYIKRCLDAISRQTVMPLEVIVVDNNCTDKTIEIAERYPFVRVVKEHNRGVLFARNKGFNLVKADVIGRIDADTVLPYDWTEQVLKDFQDDRFGAVTGPVSYYDMPLPWVNYWLDHWLRKGLVNLVPQCPFLFGSNMAVRRSTWLDIKAELCNSQQIHEDLDLAIHLNQQDYAIKYDKFLHAGASARRYEDSWANFKHYGLMFRQSYRKHGIKSIAPRLVTSYYTLGYIVLRPSRRLYDPVSGHRSIRYALTHERESARKNPMAH